MKMTIFWDVALCSLGELNSAASSNKRHYGTIKAADMLAKSSCNISQLK
jgi:hypothetical protein